MSRKVALITGASAGLESSSRGGSPDGHDVILRSEYHGWRPWPPASKKEHGVKAHVIPQQPEAAEQLFARVAERGLAVEFSSTMRLRSGPFLTRT